MIVFGGFDLDVLESAAALPRRGAGMETLVFRSHVNHKISLFKTHPLPSISKTNNPVDTFSDSNTSPFFYDLVGPDCGQVSVVVDGGEPEVKPRFDAYCTYHRLATLSVAEGLPDAVHNVRIAIHPKQPDKEKILSQRGEKMDDPKRFDGPAWYAGAMLVIGDVVE